jgi:hypothetical protein
LSLRSDLEIVSGHLISKNMLRFSRNSGKLGFFLVVIKVDRYLQSLLLKNLDNLLYSIVTCPGTYNSGHTQVFSQHISKITDNRINCGSVP